MDGGQEQCTWPCLRTVCHETRRYYATVLLLRCWFGDIIGHMACENCYLESFSKAHLWRLSGGSSLIWTKCRETGGLKTKCDISANNDVI